LFAEQQTSLVPAGLLVSARIANMVVGLGVIPVLIHFLGGDGFAAWAVLLATSAAFSALEVGMPLTFVKHAAPLIQQGSWTQVNVVLNHSAAILVIVFLAAAPAVFFYAEPIARLLHLPGGGWLSAAQMIETVYAAVALRALFQFGGLTFNAARRFRALAAVSFLQSLTANCAAALAALWSRQLDITIIAYWTTQLFFTAATFLVARRLFIKTLRLVYPRFGELRELAVHGLKIQAYDWAQIINFQFDKFLIASYMGLWTVAPYEVANRSVLALRSIPSSGLDSFLSTAAIVRESGVDAWPRYLSATRLAASAVIIFMIAPLAVAPVFLYAWTGEMGYSARWVFLFLLVGAAGNVLALPAASMAQAAGRAGIQAHSAIVSMLVNIPLSIILVLQWQMTGAAAGSAVAMLSGSAILLFEVHRSHGQALSATMKGLLKLWPLLIVCLACGLVVYAPFEHWLSSLDSATRYSWQTRAWLGLLSGGAYLVCLTVMAVVQIHRGALSGAQYDFLVRWIRFKWFAAYCAAKNPD
jgi:O-antigen/teichoic acid export membrane protein